MKTVKYQVCAKGQDWCKQNEKGLQLVSGRFDRLFLLPPNVYFNIVNIVQKVNLKLIKLILKLSVSLH